MAISRWAALLAAVVALFAFSQAKAQVVGDVIQGQFISTPYDYTILHGPGNGPGYQHTSGGVLNTAGPTWNVIGGNASNGFSGLLWVNFALYNNMVLSTAKNVATGATISAFIAPMPGPTPTSPPATTTGVNAVGPPNYNGFAIGPTPNWSLMNNYAYSPNTTSGQNTGAF
ncbi:MAG: hypothetical protein ACKO23_02910, partial [Gemmataceae bacterium]